MSNSELILNSIFRDGPNKFVYCQLLIVLVYCQLPIDMAGLLDLVGNTPMVELKNIPTNKSVTVYAKLEGNNPGGSVKDRAAYGMIKGAIDRGELKPGMKLIEATSGNTGIALAMIAGLFGVEIELVMPEDATGERALTMKVF